MAIMHPSLRHYLANPTIATLTTRTKRTINAVFITSIVSGAIFICASYLLIAQVAGTQLIEAVWVLSAIPFSIAPTILVLYGLFHLAWYIIRRVKSAYNYMCKLCRHLQ